LLRLSLNVFGWRTAIGEAKTEIVVAIVRLNLSLMHTG